MMRKLKFKKMFKNKKINRYKKRKKVTIKINSKRLRHFRKRRFLFKIEVIQIQNEKFKIEIIQNEKLKIDKD